VVAGERIKGVIEDSPYYETINFGYPNIAKKVRVFWGYPEFTKLMQELQTDSSDRPRAQFPGDVLFAISELQTIHDLGYPRLVIKEKSIWNIKKKSPDTRPRLERLFAVTR
jgi:hypothetical protein